MDNKRVSLTKEQIEHLSTELLEKLHEKPLYDIDGKRNLISEYIKNVENIIVHNIKNLINDGLDDNARSILGQIFRDRMIDG